MSTLRCNMTITHVIFIVLITSLFTPVTSLLAVENPKPRYAPGVVSIVHSHDYIRKHTAQTYWKISPYYLPQLTESSCSLASATMIINAARSDQVLYASQSLATQDSVVHRVKNKAWEHDVQSGGHGVTLDQLGDILSQVLKSYHLKQFKINVIHTQNKSQETVSRLHHVLIENEKTGRSFMIANFNHKFFTGTESAGHFSPIGAYDSETKRVLIMDPYRALYEPYWVPEKLFLDSMVTVDDDAHAFRGYLLIRWTDPTFRG